MTRWKISRLTQENVEELDKLFGKRMRRHEQVSKACETAKIGLFLERFDEQFWGAREGKKKGVKK